MTNAWAIPILRILVRRQSFLFPPSISAVNWAEVSHLGGGGLHRREQFGAEDFGLSRTALLTVSNVKNKKIKAALTWISDSRVMVNFPAGADLATLTIQSVTKTPTTLTCGTLARMSKRCIQRCQGP